MFRLPLAAIRGLKQSFAHCITCRRTTISSIFGGVHPNEIKPHQPIDPVVSSLFDAGYVDTSVAERIAGKCRVTAPAVSVAVDSSMRDLLIEHPKDLSDRIHFLGCPERHRFPRRRWRSATPWCSLISKSANLVRPDFPGDRARLPGDRLANPYLFSAPSLSPATIEFFDIGNHLELAGRFRHARNRAGERRPAFNVETNRRRRCRQRLDSPADVLSRVGV